MNLKILITGGAGYIGSSVANYLIDNGHHVTIVDNLITGNRNLVPKKANLKICDIADQEKISLIIQETKFDLVMHFAGLIRVDESLKQPKKYNDYNYLKGKIFFETCFKNNLNKIVFSSTASVYGNSSKKKVSENDELNPNNPYALSKFNLEKYLFDQSKKLPVNFIILRYFNVAGTEDKMRTGLISNFSTHLIKVACEVAQGKRKELIINGNDYDTIDGTPVRDFIHINDLSHMHLLAANDLVKKKISNIFNCGYGVGFSVDQVVNTLNKIVKFKIPILIGKRREGDSQHTVANSEKFAKYFLWEPKYNNLELIIKSSLEWEKILDKNFIQKKI